MDTSSLIACPDCDLLHRISPLPEGGEARCVRCGATLYEQKPGTLERSLALSLAGLICFLLALAAPLVRVNLQGNIQEAGLVSGVMVLVGQGRLVLGLTVLIPCVLLPLMHLAGLVYVLLPLRLGLQPPRGGIVFRFVLTCQAWAMMEVFLLGILVAYVKLVKLAGVSFGGSLVALGAFILLESAVVAALEPHEIWERLA